MMDKVDIICRIARNLSNVGKNKIKSGSKTQKKLLTLCVLNTVYTCIMIFLTHNHYKCWLLWYFRGHKQNTYVTKRVKEAQSRYKLIIFEDGLFISMFGLILQSDFSTHHWYCDHHALTQSRVDDTPPVMYGCLKYHYRCYI